MEANNILSVTIAPAKQLATVREGKKVLKKYKFKMKVPFEMVSKEVDTYDYSAWSVSEREGKKTIIVKVYCQKTIKELE